MLGVFLERCGACGLVGLRQEVLRIQGPLPGASALIFDNLFVFVFFSEAKTRRLERVVLLKVVLLWFVLGVGEYTILSVRPPCAQGLARPSMFPFFPIEIQLFSVFG